MNAQRSLAAVCLICLSAAALRAGAPIAEPKPQAAPAAGAMMTVEQYPHTDGSTSAHPLTVLTACKLTGTACEWRHIFFSGQRRLVPVAPAKEAKKQPDPETSDQLQRLSAKADALTLKLVRGEATDEEVENYKETLNEIRSLEMKLPRADVHEEISKRTGASGTHGAYVRLINGEADLILECRPPSEDERKLMAEKGVELELTPVALDGFVFLLNRENPVTSLSREQIHSIYTGRITNWKAVGGPDAEIHAYQRNRNSGSQETMERVVMQGAEMIEPRTMVAMTMAGPFNALERDVHGIGFTFYYYHRFMQPDPEVKFVAVHEVMPGPELFAEGRYAFTTQVFAVTRKGLAADSPAAKVRDWLLSPAGQAVVKESGYTPLPAAAPAEGRRPVMPLLAFFRCTECGHQFTPDPDNARYEMAMEMGGAVDCPKCRAKGSTLPMTRCPACEKYYVSELTRYQAQYYASDQPPPPGPEPKQICPHCGTDYREWWRAKREERRSSR
jgi:phosphate transport system substrate-binding protein